MADRQYQLLVYKDVGKGGSQDKGEQLCFVAVGGPLSDLPAGSAALWWTVESGRAAVADFVHCKTVAKFAARLELSLSGTTPAFAGWTFEVHRELKEDVPAVRSWARLDQEIRRVLPAAQEKHVRVLEVEDIYGGLDGNGERRVMTDGAGMISLDLVRRLMDDGVFRHGTKDGGRGTPPASPS